MFFGIAVELIQGAYNYNEQNIYLRSTEVWAGGNFSHTLIDKANTRYKTFAFTANTAT